VWEPTSPAIVWASNLVVHHRKYMRAANSGVQVLPVLSALTEAFLGYTGW
jgi:hypothetical protein